MQRLAIFTFYSKPDEKQIGQIMTVCGGDHHAKLFASGYSSHSFRSAPVINYLHDRADFARLEAEETDEARDLLEDYINAAEQREANDWSALEPGTVQQEARKKSEWNIEDNEFIY